MVRANQLRKKNPYKKTLKKSKNEVDKITLPKEMKEELKGGKNIYASTVSKNNLNRKNVDDFDENVSEFEGTNIKNNLALISPIEIIENSTIKKHNCKRNIYFENEDEVELKETDYNNVKIGSNCKEIVNIKNKQNEEDDDDSDDGFYFTSTINNTNESMLVPNLYIEKSTEESFDNDIFQQGKSNIVGTVVRPIPNIKERGKNHFLHVYL